MNTTTTTTNNKPNRLFQANLALALGIAPSYVFFTSLPDSIVKPFEAWRAGLALPINYDALLGMTIFWWAPALLVFLLMVFTNFERWLKVNLLAQLSIFIANSFMFFLIGLVVYHNNQAYLWGLGRLRDSLLTTTLTFAAVVTLANMIWHYVITPNPKLRAWLTDDIFTPLMK